MEPLRAPWEFRNSTVQEAHFSGLILVMKCHLPQFILPRCTIRDKPGGKGPCGTEALRKVM